MIQIDFRGRSRVKSPTPTPNVLQNPTPLTNSRLLATPTLQPWTLHNRIVFGRMALPNSLPVASRTQKNFMEGFSFSGVRMVSFIFSVRCF